MTQAMSTISVIICAYTEERWHELVAAVTSVRSQTLLPQELIVVIDHNPALLRRAQENLSNVIAMENRGEKGLSGARNSGWSTAQGDIVAFLDDDAIAAPDWLEKLAACYADPEVTGAGGQIIPLWQSGCPSLFPEEFNWVIGCTYRGLPAKQARVRNVIGANMSMRRAVLEAAGGFREAFGCDKDAGSSRKLLKWCRHSAGDEETELCMRVSQQRPGSVWLYAASAVVEHRVGAERTRWTYFLWRCYDEGLGKASLVRLHNISTGLSAERRYTFRALPRGVARGLADTLLRFDLAGVLRAGAILVGLAVTTAGYLVGSISRVEPPARSRNLAPAASSRSHFS